MCIVNQDFLMREINKKQIINDKEYKQDNKFFFSKQEIYITGIKEINFPFHLILLLSVKLDKKFTVSNRLNCIRNHMAIIFFKLFLKRYINY